MSQNNAVAITIVGPHFADLLDMEVQRTTGRDLDIDDVHRTPAMENVDDSANDLHPALVKNLEKLKYSFFTPIQQFALPMAAKTWDIVGCAQTGSGKTAAYLLPVLNKMLEEDDYNREYKEQTCKPVALILSPTRELALQIYEQALQFAKGTKIKLCLVYGGRPWAKQVRSMIGADLIVACANRLRDLIEQQRIEVSLSQVKYLVLDEADMLLFEAKRKQTYGDEDYIGMDWLLKRKNSGMPPAGKRQTFLFSATFPVDIKQYTSQNVLTEKYVMLIVGGTKKANPDVEQQIVKVSENKKFERLVEMLADHEGRLLIFVTTRKDADNLYKRLTVTELVDRLHFDVLHSEHDGCFRANSQVVRERALARLRQSPNCVLIATNVAGRGLDIQGLDMILYYDLPEKHTDYIHGIGRTGRVGRQGKAVVFFDPETKKDSNRAMWVIDSMKQVCQAPPDWLLAVKRIRKGAMVTADLRPDMSEGHAPVAQFDSAEPGHKDPLGALRNRLDYMSFHDSMTGDWGDL